MQSRITYKCLYKDTFTVNSSYVEAPLHGGHTCNMEKSVDSPLASLILLQLYFQDYLIAPHKWRGKGRVILLYKGNNS